jgi:hypothetical protein
VQTVEFGAAIIAVFVLIGYLITVGVVARKPDGMAEEAARDYFDRHGRWPDDD